MSDEGQAEQGRRFKAVALRYEPEEFDAPRVMAKGQGEIANKIVALAKEHGVHIESNADLVEVLSVLEIDSLIPVEAYAAVAEILNFIYRTNADMKRNKGEER